MLFENEPKHIHHGSRRYNAVTDITRSISWDPKNRVIAALDCITFELPAETDQHCTCTHVTGCICDLHFADMCPKLTRCTKRISITLLVPWNHDLPQLGGLGGSPWVVPLHFGQRITMDFVMSVAGHSRGSHGSGQFHIMEPVPVHQMSQENLFGKMILKLITHFTQLI